MASIAGFRSLPLKISQLSLPAVLKCGQSFRWQSIQVDSPGNATDIPTQEWRLTLSDRVVCLRQTPTSLFYKAVFPSNASTSEEEREKSTVAWIRDYFQLDIDLEELYGEWSKRDTVFAKIKDRFGGIRMLRQDPFENVISFICSQNNHISRITSMVQNLCIHFSPQLLTIPNDDSTPVSYHPFPNPSALAQPSVEATLRELGFGYRAKYIQKTAALLCETHADPMEWLMNLRKMDVGAAREELLKLHGVGPKVADCILLMSLDKASVVPVDTHVYQIAVKHYGFRGSAGVKPNMTPKLYLDVATKLVNVWGDYAGWAHSVSDISHPRYYVAHVLLFRTGTFYR
ncbi:8-oxoguanine glycosylase ogg1 [Tulasnella sp. 419]|nr:8-oxoguanine glycosylase ogg1 [Tulasnella sp. 419]